MSNPIYDMMKQMETQKDIAEIRDCFRCGIRRA